jgi:hypothetical protein
MDSIAEPICTEFGDPWIIPFKVKPFHVYRLGMKLDAVLPWGVV